MAQQGALPEPQLGRDQEVLTLPALRHADHRIVPPQGDSDHPAGGAAHLPHVGLFEADRLSPAGGQDDLLLAVGQAHRHQLVVLVERDRDDPRPLRVDELHEPGLLDVPLFGGKEQEARIFERTDRDDRVDPLALGDGNEVDKARPLRHPARLGDLVRLDPVRLPSVAEEQDEGVVGGDGRHLHVILLLRPHPHDPAAAPLLPAVGLEQQPLDVAVVGQGDHHIGVRDQIFLFQFGVLAGDPGPPRVPEPLLDLEQLGLDDLKHLPFVAQHVLVLGDRLDQLLVLRIQLLALERGEPLEPHLEDGVRLGLAERKLLHEARPRGRHVLRLPDERDHLIERLERDLESLEDVGARLGLPELELGPAGHHDLAVVEIMREQLREGQHARDAVDEREHDRAERRLELGVLVQLVEDNLRVHVAAELDDHAHPLPVAFVPQVAHAVELLLPDQLGDPFDERRLVHHVRELGHDHGHPAAPKLLKGGLGADDHAPPPLRIGLVDPLPPEDEPPGREIGPLHDFEERLRGEAGILDQGDERLDELAQVVGGDVGGHPDRDPGGTVHEEVGDAAREDGGLLHGLVEVGHEADGLFVDVREELHRHPREPGLGVPHRPRRIAVHAAEVSLPVDQGVAEAEVLRHPHQRLVHRDVSMRMVPAHHVADEAGALLVRPVGAQPHLRRAVEDAPLHRLQPVADIRQRPADDDRHRVVQVRCPHLPVDRLGDHSLIDRHRPAPSTVQDLRCRGSGLPWRTSG